MNSMQMHRFRSSVVWLIPPADRASLHGAIAAESESATTGTKFDIAATDQIRPIARPRVVAALASLNPQAWRSMCGCTLNGILAAFPSLVIILRKPTALIGAPRSLKNR